MSVAAQLDNTSVVRIDFDGCQRAILQAFDTRHAVVGYSVKMREEHAKRDSMTHDKNFLAGVSPRDLVKSGDHA
jgi:hypothetical protein